MGFTKETLWALRREIVLNSLFLADYRNSFQIDPVAVSVFFDGYLGEIEMLIQEDDPEFNWNRFFDVLPKYDNPDTLWNYYDGMEFDLTDYAQVADQAAA